jgi:hypothetical protein
VFVFTLAVDGDQVVVGTEAGVVASDAPTGTRPWTLAAEYAAATRRRATRSCSSTDAQCEDARKQ